MNHLRRLPLLFVFASSVSIATAQQQPDAAPAGNAPPAAKAAAPAAGANAPAPEAKPIAPRNVPVVRALLQTDPKTPAELLRAIKILVDLDEAGSAQPLLQQLVDQKLDDVALAALIDQFGSAAFLRIARADALQPAAQQFTNAALTAADRHARDDKRISAEIERLKSPDADERAAAVVSLRNGRDAAVAALLAVLDDPARQTEYANVETALIQLGGESIAPLSGALAGADAPLQVKICRVLGQIGKVASIDYLLAPALAESSPTEVRSAALEALRQMRVDNPRPGDAAARLVRSARRYYDRPQEPSDSPLTDITLYYWDAKQKKLVAQAVRPWGANLMQAARMASDARQIWPDDSELRRFQLTALAESAAYQASLDKPLPTGAGTAHDLLAAEGTAVLEDLLAYSLGKDHPVAAAVAARLFGEAGQREVLTRHNSQLSPLVDALVARDRRVRFAALEAVLKLSKLSAYDTYPGAHRAIDALGYFAAGSAAPRALVADVHADEAGRLAAILAEAGYDPDIALDARSAMQLVASDRDYELIVVDALLAVPTSGQFLQQLRRDARTAQVPLAVIAAAADRPRAEHAIRAIPLAEVFVSPQNRAGMDLQIGHLMRRFGRDSVDAAERLRETEQTLAWLNDLSSSKPKAGSPRSPRPIYDLRVLDEAVIANLGIPKLAPAAIAILGNLGTPRSQVALLNLASRHTQPLTLRQAAAAAFRENLVRHGPLLTTEEIQRQYDRYNASEALDKPTQELLASILDALEARAAATQLADDPTREPATSAKQ